MKFLIFYNSNILINIVSQSFLSFTFYIMDRTFIIIFTFYIILCSFGLITNLLNAIVLLRMNKTIFKYLLTKSIVNFLYFLIKFYSINLICDQCSLNYSYESQIYRIYIDNYFCSFLVVFSVLCDNVVALKRYLILKNNKFKLKMSFVLPILISISIIFYIDVLYDYDIVVYNSSTNQSNSNLFYKVVFSKIGSSQIENILVTIREISRIIVSDVFLISLNFLLVYEFKKRYTQGLFQRNRTPIGNQSSNFFLRLR